DEVANEAEMQKIVTALMAWKKSIVNIRMVYEVTWRASHDPASATGTTAVVEGAHTHTGQERYNQAQFQNGALDYRIVWLNDGKRWCRVNYGSKQADFERPVSVMIQPARNVGGLMIEPVHDLWDPANGEFLYRLDTFAARMRIVGHREFDGIVCPVIAAREPQSGNFQFFKFQVLDSEHGFLPKRSENASVDMVGEE